MKSNALAFFAAVFTIAKNANAFASSDAGVIAKYQELNLMIKNYRLSQFGAAVKIAETGLVVHEGDDQLYVARPATVKGTEFRNRESDSVSGMGDTILKMNAPTASLTKVKGGWILDISEKAAPGPGPEWYNGKFKTLEEAVEAVIDCYFGSRINFDNDSLKSWFSK